MNYQYIASGVKTDCQTLLERFTATESVRFKEFVKIWKDMKFSCIYCGRESFAELYEFTEEVRIQVKQEDRWYITRKINSILLQSKDFLFYYFGRTVSCYHKTLEDIIQCIFYLSRVACNNFWGNSANGNKLLIWQKCRIILGDQGSLSCACQFKKFSILKLSSVCVFAVVTFTVNDNEIFLSYSDVYQVNTRYKHDHHW